MSDWRRSTAVSSTPTTCSRATDLVPLLASRREAVDRAVDELLGPLATTRSRTIGDVTGWVSGRLAADRARLSGGVLDVG